MRYFLFVSIIVFFSSCSKKNTSEFNLLDPPLSQVKVIDTAAAWGVFLKTINGSNFLFANKAIPISVNNSNTVSVRIDLWEIKDDLTVIKKKIVYEKKINNKYFNLNPDSSFFTYQCRNLSVGQFPNGRIIVGFSIYKYNYDKYGILKTKLEPSDTLNLGLHFVTSDDNGNTFSSPKKINTDNIISPNTHFNIINVSNRLSLMSCYGATNLGNTGTHIGTTESESAVYATNDYGINWFKYSTIRNSKTLPYGETTLLLTQKNLIAYVRTEDSNIWQYMSFDNGISWNKPQIVSEFLQVPAGAISMKNGDIFLFAGDRSSPPYSIVLRRSLNYGLTYSAPTKIAYTNYWNSGYPNGFELKDGSILITYYDMPQIDGQYQQNWMSSKIIVHKFTKNYIF
jgi:hypothetical protein